MDRFFAIKMIYLKFCPMKIIFNLICCSTFCELLIYKVLTKFTEENVQKSNNYVDAVPYV